MINLEERPQKYVTFSILYNYLKNLTFNKREEWYCLFLFI